jgi:catechol 2,3-dioxygenase-like lactoylglutathione lyase family enzyme
MFPEKDAMATIPVKNIAAAKKFYRDTLGLEQCDEDKEGVAVYRTGNSKLLVYQSKFAGTNKATAATWGVGDELDTIVEDLKDAGVTFEHYDLPGLHRDGDIHVAGDFKAAWFKDPDGNILHINSA